VTEQTSR